MAVSTISNDFGEGGRYTCILEEGAPTVGTGYTSTNLRLPVVTWAAELFKGEIVAIDTGTGNTHEATHGLPVVRAVVAGDTKIIGIIETEPKLQKRIPDTAAGSTLAKRLAGDYYRIATVRFFGVTNIGPATLKTANAAAIVPGVTGTLIVDASASKGGPNGIILNDVTTGGANIFSFHAAAKETGATVSLLCGFTGPLTAQE